MAVDAAVRARAGGPVHGAGHDQFQRTRRRLAERQAQEAQLRLLQGQIEPHFLFNTLANVQGLMDHDLPKAREMLASFTDYLRASLGALRNESSRVADELELARTYLLLLQARMEERLRFSIEADEVCRRQNLPPLLLQPLVENAVLHGIEPAVDGGQVRVRALQQGAQLLIEVHDDGLGPGGSGRQGHGLALDNLRQRLESTWGRAASLELVDGRPGTLARLRIPIDPATPGLERGT
jgi:LytS/YehU family sensor histidine kinase